MAKPVGTVAVRTFPDAPGEAAGSFDVAVHTHEGWVITDNEETYPFKEPVWDRPTKWPWVIVFEPEG